MSKRPPSENPEAVRKRLYRERKRLERAQATSGLPSAQVPSADAPPPLALPPGPPIAIETPRVSVEGPATSVPLTATEVVQGPGADTFAGPTLLDLGGADGTTDAANDNEDDEGPASSPRLVDPVEKPKEKTSPEEAAVLAKLVGMYVGFGWGLLASKHEDKLGPLAEQVAAMVVRAKPEVAEMLGRLSSREKFQLGLGMLVGVVEDAASKVCVERNIRIPWQNELIVAGGIGTATLGIVGEFGGKREPEPQAQPEPSPAPPPRAPRPSWSSQPTVTPTDAEIVDERPPAPRAVESNW